jgi:peptidyl-prolyl cis-trans isomerase A (cyclophilin A)
MSSRRAILRLSFTVCLLTSTLLWLSAGLAAAQDAAAPVRVRFQTDLGSFEIEVDVAHAPVTAANFLKYVDGGFYDGGQVHRSARLETQATRPVKIEVIQAAINAERSSAQFPPIPLERTSATGLLHRDGVISMARGGPDSGRSDFFICIGDQPSLDFGGARNPDGQGFAAFGRVVSGQDVVRAIHRAPSDGETLKPPVRILKAQRK